MFVSRKCARVFVYKTLNRTEGKNYAEQVVFTGIRLHARKQDSCLHSYEYSNLPMRVILLAYDCEKEQWACRECQSN